MKVSVIIPAYNCGLYLPGAIASVFSQTYANYELIIVNDGSTDDTAEILAIYQSKGQAEKENSVLVQVIYQSNQGVAAARNRGLKAATGELIAFLDADDSFWPEKLTQQVACFEASPSLGLVIGGWQLVNQDGEQISQVEPWKFAPSLDLETAILQKPARPSATMVRRDWCERMGGFDSRLRSAEDLDFLLRLLAAGCEAAWIRKILVSYRQRSDSLMAQGKRLIEDTERVMEGFFARSDLPSEILRLKQRERYQSWVWLGARMYYDGYIGEMESCLRRSCRYPTVSSFQILQDWFQAMQGYATEYGYEFDAYGLTSSEVWQKLTRSLLPASNQPLSRKKKLLSSTGEQNAEKNPARNAARIVLYSDDPGAGGILQCNHAIACHLVQVGYQVSHLHCLQETPLNAREIELGIRQVDLGYHAGADLTRTLKDLEGSKQHLLKIQPDLVIFSDGWPFSNLAAKQAAIDLGIPYMIVLGFIESSCTNYDYRDGVDYQRLVALQYAQACAVVSVSQENLSLLRQLFDFSASLGQVIYNGRPEVFFAEPDLQSRGELRRSLGIPSEAVVCFTSARLEAVKGHEYQIEAIRQLKTKPIWENLYFLWAGVGEEVLPQSNEAELRAAVEALGVGDRVRFLGQRWDIPELLDASDIFVLTSEAEGMPLSVMEAMAKGLPVVASAVSGVPEELGETGQLLPDPNRQPEETVRVLVQTIERWASSASLRRLLGRECQRRARRLFREVEMVGCYGEVVASCLRNFEMEDGSVSALDGLNLQQEKEVQRQFRYAAWVWRGWFCYQQGDPAGMEVALEEALRWRGRGQGWPVMEWGRWFARFCEERGMAFDGVGLARSLHKFSSESCFNPLLVQQGGSF